MYGMAYRSNKEYHRSSQEPLSHQVFHCSPDYVGETGIARGGGSEDRVSLKYDEGD
jgi:hypothetical protein